jgi:hypothetical protein
MSDEENNYSESESEEVNPEISRVMQDIEEYEEEQKKERKPRKKRVDALFDKQQLEVSLDDLKTIKITKKQIADIRRKHREEEKVAKKERTEKQKKATAEMREKLQHTLDLRRNKLEQGITLEIKKSAVKVVKKPREPAVPKIKEVIIEDDEEEEEPPKKFQGRKPKLEDIDEKIEKLSKINQVIEQPNPYLAMIMRDRNRGRM